MNNFDVIVINVHKIVDNGSVVSSIRHEMDPNSKEVLSRTYFSNRDMDFNPLRNKHLYLNYQRFEAEETKVRCIKMVDNDFVSLFKPILNIPTMIRCQNCETNFPTKYQYQRHQCEFNSEKIVLKSEINDTEDADDAIRVKYVCQVCDRQFVSRINLERHESSHEKNQENMCEHCNKRFVSENRLRIHKENHCKKAGDISKFYRSDVTVWKCKKCKEVFSSNSIANYHLINCNHVLANDEDDRDEENFEQGDDNKLVLKMLTEVLFQCEFCNKTYCNKNHLLSHQRKHTTSKSYECSNCLSIFDSYATAVQHWLKKCTEYVNIFFLPRFTYCEYCDRPFKSHELLYTHKIKKKHYTTKIHLGDFPSTDNVEQVEGGTKKTADTKEALSKLIEDVLKTLDVPIKKIKTSSHFTEENFVKNGPTSSYDDTFEEKSDNSENIQPSISDGEVSEVKRRGRRRKWMQKPQVLKQKMIQSASSEKGFKYQCERCAKVFDAVPKLDEHRDKEHASNFKCDECKQILHSAKALLIHSRAHKSLKPYVCETCGRSYSQTSHLWQHMRFHQGIKPFACPHEGCEARYTIRPDLKDHIRKVHTRERPFKCNVCNKCFLTGSVYYQHRLIHTNDRRYACDLCPKRFFRADALNNHRRIHTDERPYPCHVCGREFRQKGDRNKHLRTQHPDDTVLI